MVDDLSATEYIVVNATALEKSGALTILRQFLDNASKDIVNNYLCFVPKGLCLEVNKNIKLIEVGKMSWIQRILWDSLKIKKYLNVNKISYNKVISLQNTTVNVNKNAKQIVYLHQSLPFSSIKWSIFEKQQFKFFLYKHFYSFFIFMFANEETTFVVQTQWMKDALVNKFNVNSKRIYVIKPDIILPSMLQGVLNKSHEKKLLYPATPLFYKNHRVIVEAFNILKSKFGFNNIKFQVTFSPEDYRIFNHDVKRYGLGSNIEYLGVLPYDELIKRYQSSDLILFPSYIETFGLPLAEAATLGKPIICSDLEFSREVLNGYSGALYVEYNNSMEWAKAIKLMLEQESANDCRFIKYKYDQSSSWKDFFQLL